MPFWVNDQPHQNRRQDTYQSYQLNVALPSLTKFSSPKPSTVSDLSVSSRNRAPSISKTVSSCWHSRVNYDRRSPRNSSKTCLTPFPRISGRLRRSKRLWSPGAKVVGMMMMMICWICELDFLCIRKASIGFIIMAFCFCSRCYNWLLSGQ